MKATIIRKGQILLINKVLYRVLVMDHVTPGKGRAHVQTKLRSLIDGTQSEMRFRSDDNVEKAHLEHRNMQYLYGDADGHHFMDTETYEQIQLTEEVLGDAAQYIIPEQTVVVLSHDGNPLGIELPSIVELKVVECPPGVKDATASAQRKPAKMETGLIVPVPAFINEGETLRINTTDGSYSERAGKVSR
jgi:elongation factor P